MLVKKPFSVEEIVIFFIVLCAVFIAFQSGKYFERRYIKQSIKSGQENSVGKTIRIPQLKVIISKDNITWED